jgi:NAD(P)-dependent dehydrogenase (short-subunit alcohol dehydrogenase family)
LPGVTFFETDTTSWSSLISLFEFAKETMGGIDIIAANAGMHLAADDRGAGSAPDNWFRAKGVSTCEDYLPGELDENGKLKEPTHNNLRVNLIGCMNSVILGLHYLRQQGEGGAIVITASASSMSFSFH